MRFEIDTNLKQMKLLEPAKYYDLAELMKKMFPEDWLEWTLISDQSYIPCPYIPQPYPIVTWETISEANSSFNN